MDDTTGEYFSKGYKTMLHLAAGGTFIRKAMQKLGKDFLLRHHSTLSVRDKLNLLISWLAFEVLFCSDLLLLLLHLRLVNQHRGTISAVMTKSVFH